MLIAHIARSDRSWAASPVGFNEGTARAFEEQGHTVARLHTGMSRKDMFAACGGIPELSFFPKLRRFPRWIADIPAPTVCFYGDWRPSHNSEYKAHRRAADVLVCQYENPDAEGWAPAPIWCDNYDHSKPKKPQWLWTGQRSVGKDFDRYRNTDTQCLPSGTPLHGFDRTPPITGWDYVHAIEEHQWGLSVSHRHDIPRYTSSRLGYYQAGGMTCAVRWFPGVEELAHPDQPVYRTEQQLREIVSDPPVLDPAAVALFARRVYDCRTFARRVLTAAGTENAS